MEPIMRAFCLTLAMVMLASHASATDVCEALDGEEGAAVTLSGVLSFEDGEIYINQGGCRMIVSLTPDKKDVCPSGVEATIVGDVDLDWGMLTDDLIVYADEITCP
jgi:hypothetical protein